MSAVAPGPASPFAPLDLWLVEPITPPRPYVVGMVVAAESERDACCLHPASTWGHPICGDWVGDQWVLWDETTMRHKPTKSGQEWVERPSLSKATHLGKANPGVLRGVILAAWEEG